MSGEPKTYGPSVPVQNIVIPREGPRTLKVTLNFEDFDFFDIEGLLPVTTGKISYIQGVYVDNANNPAQLTLLAKTTQQRIVVPAYGQGYYPILFAQVPDLRASTTQADIDVFLHFYNVPIQAQYWLANDAAPVTSGSATAANQVLQLAQETLIALSASVLDDWDEADRAKVNLIAGQAGITAGAGNVAANTPRVTLATDYIAKEPIGGAWTDRSIAALSGASEALMAGNANRRHLFIQNVSGNNMGINLAGGAAVIGGAGTITLTPGSALEIFNYPPVAAITIIGTAADIVTAYEG